MAQDIVARGMAGVLKATKANLVDGKVPASELPSYVSDIVEVATYEDLPTTGASNTIYVVKQPTQTTYRWTGTSYIPTDEKSQYYSVKVSSTNITTMGDLKTYIDDINGTGLHCFFDFSDFISGAYICTASCFTQNSKKFCVVFDLIHEKTYIDYDGYEDSETVQTYVNRTGEDSPKIITITDSSVKVQDIADILTETSTSHKHVLFDFSALETGCHLCTVECNAGHATIIDIMGARVIKEEYTSSTTVSSLLAELSNLVDQATIDGAFNEIDIEEE